MRLRSLLFVPGDSERKFAKARMCGADVLILDLEDAVATSRKADARMQVAARVGEREARSWRLFVRPNPLETGLLLHDLAAIVRPGLDGLLVPKVDGAADIERICHYLDALEAAAGMPAGSVSIAVVATETPQAMFKLASYAPPHPRLVALTWGAEDLAAALGAVTNKEDDGCWTAPYQLARTQCLLAAASAGVAPLETLFADYRDLTGLGEDCRRARRDGFTGRICIHPDQVQIVNDCFTPSPHDLAAAQRIVDAFAANPEAGAIGIDGKMYDIPHLAAARRTLASAEPR